MTAMPFQPVADRARWRIVYDDILSRLGVGDEITYAQLGTALDLSPDTERHQIQMAMRRAGKELLEMTDHAIDVIPNKGYRIVQPTEHLSLARRDQRRSSKALARGHLKVVHVDFNGMDPEIRKAFEITATAFSGMIEMQRRMYRRQAELSVAIEATENRVERSESELAELRSRMDRLEKLADPPTTATP